MTIASAEIHQALRAAQVPDETAWKAAEAIGEVITDVRLLKWMIATNIAFSVTLLGAIGGIYLLIFNVMARLPR